MAESRRLFGLGRYPGQGMYGALGLERAGYACDYLDTGAWPGGDRLTDLFKGRLGDFAIQRSARKRDAAVIFAANEGPLAGLAVSRRLSRIPLAAIFHSPPAEHRQARLAARNYDVTFALSRLAHEGLLSLGLDPATTHLLRWGPQLDYPHYRATGDGRVVSAGKSLRDIDLLAEALDRAAVPGLVYCPPGWNRQTTQVTPRPFSQVEEYPVILGDMAQASAIAIPLLRTDRMLGLSEVNDALALGKPIVMTRTAHLDLDLEAIGCGIFIDGPDVQAWAEALAFLHSNPAQAAEMGAKGRRWAAEHWNSALCDQQVVQGLAHLAA